MEIPKGGLVGKGYRAVKYLGNLHIGLYASHASKFTHSFCQNGHKALIQLHGADLPCPQRQLLGQRSDAGTDL